MGQVPEPVVTEAVVVGPYPHLAEHPGLVARRRGGPPELVERRNRDRHAGERRTDTHADRREACRVGVEPLQRVEVDVGDR